MNLFVTIVGVTIFAALQAFYWFSRSRSGARTSALLDKLGGAANLGEVSLLRRFDESEGLIAGWRTRLRQAGEPPELAPFISKMTLWGLVGALVGLIIGGAMGTAVAGGLTGALLPVLQLGRRRRQRMMDIEKNLPEALQVLIISLKAGHALPKAIETTSKETPGPLRDELQLLGEELKLGRSVEEALLRFGNRLSAISTVRTFVVAVIVLIANQGAESGKSSINIGGDVINGGGVYCVQLLPFH